MDTNAFLIAVKAQTDAMILEAESFKRGYLSALAWATQKMAELDPSVVANNAETKTPTTV